MDETQATPSESKRRPYFRKAPSGPRLSGDEAKRQGAITSLAFRLLGSRDAAVAFLNTHDPALDGRPLDLATASSAGFDQVETALTRTAAGD
jgi:uncharacterized protein (DUF2384 family)